MNEDPAEFRHRRIEAGLSQAELARRVGLGRSRICDVEKDRPGRGLSPQHLEAIAKIFGCDVHDLLLPDADDTTGVIRSIRAAIDYRCPACDAHPKRACLTPAGKRFTGVHRARVRIAERAGSTTPKDVA